MLSAGLGSFLACSEVWVLIHEVVVVRNFPVARGLVSRGQNVAKVLPSHVGLEAHDVLSRLIVVVAQKNLRVVLILDVELHGRLNEGSDGNTVGSVVGIKAIKEVSLVVLGRVVSAAGAHEGRLGHVPVLLDAIGSPFDVEAVGDLNL